MMDGTTQSRKDHRMAETLPCPDCKAELVLPALPKGQTVQCPRCQRVFEPGYARPAMAASPAAGKKFDPHSGTNSDGFDKLADDARLPPPYEPLRHEWKAPVAMILLAACVASYALQLYVHAEQSLVFQLQQEFGVERFDPFGEFRRPRFRPPPRDERLVDLDRRRNNVQALAEISEALHHLTFWPTLLFVVLWIHQAAWNLRTLKASGLIYAPSLAALSFFIPIVNLFQPFSAIQEIWRASDPRVARAPRSWQQAPYSMTARIWWLAFLAAGALSLYALWIGREMFLDNADSLLQARVRFVSNVCMIVAGVALIVLIRGIQVRQRERHARIYDEAE
jgi:hypothetical protein